MKTYIIDLDGTMYRGNTNIDGAREFIDYLHLKNLPYIFLLVKFKAKNYLIYFKKYWTIKNKKLKG